MVATDLTFKIHLDDSFFEISIQPEESVQNLLEKISESVLTKLNIQSLISFGLFGSVIHLQNYGSFYIHQYQHPLLIVYTKNLKNSQQLMEEYGPLLEIHWVYKEGEKDLEKRSEVVSQKQKNEIYLAASLDGILWSEEESIHDQIYMKLFSPQFGKSPDTSLYYMPLALSNDTFEQLISHVDFSELSKKYEIIFYASSLPNLLSDLPSKIVQIYQPVGYQLPLDESLYYIHCWGVLEQLKSFLNLKELTRDNSNVTELNETVTLPPLFPTI